MTIFFTADTHFHHKNIIKYTERHKLWSTAEEMNEGLIEAWNSVVQRGDTVYHLGDFMMGDTRALKTIIERLKGKIHLVPGNHDKPEIIHYFDAELNRLRAIKVPCGGKEQKLVLCHYAMRVWDKSHMGSWHLYGHSHAMLEGQEHGLSMDVGVDAIALRGLGYRPIALEEVEQIMSTREMAYKPVSPQDNSPDSFLSIAQD